jgi:NADH:ubiquinone reductase (H+-translocating)
VQPEDARVVLFDGGEAPLASFGPQLSRRATRTLRELGVELRMNSIVTSVDGDGLRVRAEDGTESGLDAATVLWTAGVEAPPLAAALAAATGAEQDRSGRIPVQDDLTIAGHAEISVIGDLLTGQGEPKPFKYHDLGSAAYVSRGRAVVSAGPLRLWGFPGWLAWLFIHIAFLTGYRNRLGAILTWWVAFTRDVRRERAYTTRGVGRVKDLYYPSEAEQAPAAGAQAPALPTSGRSVPRSGD